MPLVNGRYVSPTWLNNAPPAIDQTELQAITDTLAGLDSGSGGGPGKRYVNFVIGTSTNGWTTDDCDYLCDGIADNVEIQQAINDLSQSGGEIKFLSGTYNILATINIESSLKSGITLSGCGESSVLNFSPSVSTGIYCTSSQPIKVSNLGFFGFQGINIAGGIFSSCGCFYENSHFVNLNSVSLFYNNTFLISQNMSSNYIISILGYPLLLYSNYFSFESGVTSPTTCISLGENGIACGNKINKDGGTAIFGLNGSTICGNSISNSTISATFNSSVSGNYVYNGSISANQSSISGNSIIGGSINGSEGCSICGNTIYQETPVNQSCIYITKSRNNESETAFTVISGNTCNGGNIGIFLDTNSFSYKAQSHAVITGNACSSLVPLQIESNWSNCLITGNMFPNGAIVDNGSGNTKANNVTGT